VKPGFRSVAKVGIVLKAGDRERADIRLEIGIGCCEYAAGPLKVPDYVSEKKSFTYIVGDADVTAHSRVLPRLCTTILRHGW
jgi:hypothetical protein